MEKSDALNDFENYGNAHTFIKMVNRKIFELDPDQNIEKMEHSI